MNPEMLRLQAEQAKDAIGAGAYLVGRGIYKAIFELDPYHHLALRLGHGPQSGWHIITIAEPGDKGCRCWNFGLPQRASFQAIRSSAQKQVQYRHPATEAA